MDILIFHMVLIICMVVQVFIKPRVGDFFVFPNYLTTVYIHFILMVKEDHLV